METWPTSILPAPTVDLGADAQVLMARTDMDSSRVRQRQRTSRVGRLFNASWELSDFQYGMFQSWVKHKLHNGADQFYIDLPTGGDGMKTVTARIVNGKYSDKYVPVLNWKVNAVLEVDDPLVWSESIFDGLLADAEYANPPRSQAFNVDLTEGVATQDIVFPHTFGLLGAPPGLKVQLLTPEDGFNFEVLVVEVSIDENGFTVNFGALVPGPGYSLSVIATF